MMTLEDFVFDAVLPLDLPLHELRIGVNNKLLSTQSQRFFQPGDQTFVFGLIVRRPADILAQSEKCVSLAIHDDHTDPGLSRIAPCSTIDIKRESVRVAHTVLSAGSAVRRGNGRFSTKRLCCCPRREIGCSWDTG